MESRLPFAKPDELSPEAREALDKTPDLAIFKVLANAEAAFPAFVGLLARLWDDSELSPRHRELAILTVARVEGSEYEWSQHVEVARLCGIDQQEIDRLEDLDFSRFDETETGMLELVVATARPGSPDPDLFARVRAEIGERRITELILITTIYAGIAAMIDAFGLEVDSHRGVYDLELGEEGPKLGG